VQRELVGGIGGFNPEYVFSDIAAVIFAITVDVLIIVPMVSGFAFMDVLLVTMFLILNLIFFFHFLDLFATP
jgi:hypothetical protein